jgi:hypothetical protein
MVRALKIVHKEKCTVPAIFSARISPHGARRLDAHATLRQTNAITADTRRELLSAPTRGHSAAGLGGNHCCHRSIGGPPVEPYGAHHRAPVGAYIGLIPALETVRRPQQSAFTTATCGMTGCAEESRVARSERADQHTLQRNLDLSTDFCDLPSRAGLIDNQAHIFSTRRARQSNNFAKIKNC